MEKIRIDTGVKKIEVNDAGECITVNVADTTFFKRYSDFLTALEGKQTEVDAKAAELARKYPGEQIENDSGDINVEMVADIVELYKELCDWTIVQLDKLFGAGCCMKVFPGVESPGLELIADFLDAINPILQKYAEERNEKINLRYNRNRKGARSK